MRRQLKKDFYVTAQTWDEFNEKIWPKKEEEIRLLGRYSKNFPFSSPYLIGLQIDLPHNAENTEKERDFLKRLDEVATAASDQVSKYTNCSIWVDSFRNRGTNKIRAGIDIISGPLCGYMGYMLGEGNPITTLAGIAAGILFTEFLIAGSSISNRKCIIRDLKGLYKKVTIKYKSETSVVKWE